MAYFGYDEWISSSLCFWCLEECLLLEHIVLLHLIIKKVCSTQVIDISEIFCNQFILFCIHVDLLHMFITEMIKYVTILYSQNTTCLSRLLHVIVYLLQYFLND